MTDRNLASRQGVRESVISFIAGQPAQDAVALLVAFVSIVALGILI